MIKARFRKNSQQLTFDCYEDIVICLRARAGLWRSKENDSNASYKRQALKRIKRMYGIVYENKNQSDKEFIVNLHMLGEIAELVED